MLKRIQAFNHPSPLPVLALAVLGICPLYQLTQSLKSPWVPKHSCFKKYLYFQGDPETIFCEYVIESKEFYN